MFSWNLGHGWLWHHWDSNSQQHGESSLPLGLLKVSIFNPKYTDTFSFFKLKIYSSLLCCLYILYDKLWLEKTFHTFKYKNMFGKG